MRGSTLRVASIAAGIAGLALGGLPAAHAATHGAAKRPAIGDSCLVGTWHDNAGKTTTNWDGHTVKMHAGGGDVDHIFASGIDKDNWQSSKPIVGKYQGHKLTEQIRGHNKVRFAARPNAHPAKLTITELGWTAKSSNRFVYRGQHSTGYLNQSGTIASTYRCTSTTLTYLMKGKVVSTETRVSTKP
jgi:hypothetical protein